MRRFPFAVLLLSIGAGLTLAARAVPPWAAFPLGWTALAALALGAIYLAAAPRAFLKRADGTLHPISWLVFAPYHAASLTTLAIFHVLEGERVLHEVEPGVFLGCRLLRPDARLEGAAVLDLAAELAEAPFLRARPGYASLPALDGLDPPDEVLARGVSWIRERRASGSPVYVHCAMGHGRSATVVAAWLLDGGHAATAAEAVARLKAVRRGVRIRGEERAALGRFAAQVASRSGSTTSTGTAPPVAGS